MLALLFVPCVISTVRAQNPDPRTRLQTNAEDTDRALKVLFLGDEGQHRPLDRARVLVPALLERGIEVVYTEHLGDLKEDVLRRYDALLVYENRKTLKPGQEKALLNYIDRGGGLVALHSASKSFPGSEAWVNLLGAQHRSHEAGSVETRITNPDHPLMRGYEGFTSHDQRYVHRKHNRSNRTVLAKLDDEPYTWVRTRGDGRVFYTARGHDRRTWTKQGFLNLVERAIRWTSGSNKIQEAMDASPTLDSLEFAEQDIPYNRPGEWNRMQRPLGPEPSRKRIIEPGGFQVELFATEPDVVNPIDMSWDARGRLWIVETVDYPNNFTPKGKGNDRIKICEDTDGDGRADEFTIFADGLNMPTSMVFAGGGVIVHEPPRTLFLKDTNGDDKADERRVLFEGWSTRDTHAGPSNLTYGLDNWIWGTVGYARFQGDVGGKSHKFRAGVYRFRPDGSSIEFVRSAGGNVWGLDINEEGHVFGTMATSADPGFYVGVPNRYENRVRGWSRKRVPGIDEWPGREARALTMTDRVRQWGERITDYDWFTAASGYGLYTARTYPRRYWNRAGFIAETTGHLLSTFLIEEQGGGYKALNGYNLAASNDAWFTPIQAKVGPDGNVWFLDWYNYIVQHNPAPKGYKSGKGNAYVTELRDRSHGRIYRVTYDGETTAETGNSGGASEMNLLNATPSELVDALTHSNMLWRKHAQRLLVERGRRDVEDQLITLVNDRSVGATDLNVGAIHALWTLHGLVAFEQSGAALKAAYGALEHPAGGVRENAVRVLPHNNASRKRILKTGLLHDDDAKVRLAALLALADMPASRSAGASVFALLAEPRNYRDRWIRDAATAAGARHHAGFLESAGAVGSTNKKVKQVVEIVRRHAKKGEGKPDETESREPQVIPYLEGGNAKRGRRIFFNNKIANCTRCHTINGEGGTLGPDLSDIGQRKSRRYIVKSLLKPNAMMAASYDENLSPMPRARAILDDQQIRDVAAFLESLPIAGRED